MPYVFRDQTGKIVRASTHPLVSAEQLPYDAPDLKSFLSEKGQDPSAIDRALAELRKTDLDMTRAIEDVIVALLKKNVLKMTDLPKPVQEKMALRVKLRVLIQEVFDQASGTQSIPSSTSIAISTLS